MPISQGVRGVAQSLPAVKSFIHVLTGGISNAVGDTTESDDTVSAVSTVRVTGSLSQTQAADTVLSAGVVPNNGVFSKTEAADTVASAGVVSNHGTTSVVEANDGVLSVGSILIKANAPFAGAPDTLVTSGWSGSITGSFSVTTLDRLAATALSPILQSLGITHFFRIGRLILNFEIRETLDFELREDGSLENRE